MPERFLETADLSATELDDAYDYNDRFTEAHQLLSDEGVADLAHEQVEAHGRRMSMAAAIAGCDPFKEGIHGTVDALKAAGVDDPEAIRRGLRRSLERQLAKAPETVNTGAEKK